MLIAVVRHLSESRDQVESSLIEEKTAEVSNYMLVVVVRQLSESRDQALRQNQVL